MKYQEKCECCCGTVTAFTHSINKPMAESFCRFIERYDEVKRPVNVNTELSYLTHNQLCNFNKLQYFGLIQHVEGGWVPTTLGHQFYYSEVPVVNPVATMGNKVIADDHQAWKTHTRRRVELYLKDITGVFYKRREEYQEEKSAQTKMFDVPVDRTRWL